MSVTDWEGLRITTGDKYSVGALRGSVSDETLHLSDANGIGASREKVCRESSGIVDALNRDLARKGGLKAVGNIGTDNGTLSSKLASASPPRLISAGTSKD